MTRPQRVSAQSVVFVRRCVAARGPQVVIQTRHSAPLVSEMLSILSPQRRIARQIWSCNGTSAQGWKGYHINSTQFELVLRENTGWCANDLKGDLSDGAHVGLYYCNGNDKNNDWQ